VPGLGGVGWPVGVCTGWPVCAVAGWWGPGCCRSGGCRGGRRGRTGTLPQPSAGRCPTARAALVRGTESPGVRSGSAGGSRYIPSALRPLPTAARCHRPSPIHASAPAKPRPQGARPDDDCAGRPETGAPDQFPAKGRAFGAVTVLGTAGKTPTRGGRRGCPVPRPQDRSGRRADLSHVPDAPAPRTGYRASPPTHHPRRLGETAPATGNPHQEHTAKRPRARPQPHTTRHPVNRSTR